MQAFIGPSYQLATRAADVQRTINTRPVPIESGSGGNAFMLQENPGLIRRVSLSGEGRGAFALNGRKFVVVGDKLYEINLDNTSTERGTLITSSGRVDIQANMVELFMVDGVAGYTLNFSTNVFAANVGVTGMAGSKRAAYLDQYAIYAPSGAAFYLSALADAGSVDPLSFASAEAFPDNLVAHVVANRQLYLLGSDGGEVWINTGANPDMPLQRYDGTVMGVGCIATYSAVVCNGVPAWVGSSKDGSGEVWVADGYTPRRISTRAIEEMLSKSSDLTAAYAYTWSWKGSVFYCLRAPGLETTLCYDFLTQSWHEQAELIEGAYSQHRVCATMASDGLVWALGDDGTVYVYDDDTYSFDGDTKCRDRISPHDKAGGERQFFSQFELDVDTGVTGEAMLRVSNDGGATWGDFRRRSLGEDGKQRQRLIWNRCGSARDRVWHVRCTDPVPFSMVNATVT